MLSSPDFSNSDIICITEHWLRKDDFECYVIPNYKVLSKFCRINKKPGGSCIFVKLTLQAKPLAIFENISIEENFEASMVEVIQFKIAIICIYRTPSSNHQNLVENVDSVLKELLNIKKVIIVGDINVNFLGNLESLLNTYGLPPIINEPTNIGKKKSKTG